MTPPPTPPSPPSSGGSARARELWSKARTATRAAAAFKQAALKPSREIAIVGLATLPMGMGLDEENVVLELAPGGAAEACGLREGDRVQYVDGPVSYTHLTLPTICSV